PVAVLGWGQPQLGEDAADVLLDRALGDDEPGCDAVVRVTLRHQCQYLSLPRRQLAERIAAVPLRDELVDEGRVHDRAAARDPFERVDEVGDAHDPALQQVADSLTAFEEVDRGLDLDVRREQQDPDLRELAADSARRLEALPRLRWRHADVDHRKIRCLVAHDLIERVRVAGLADDLVAGVRQEARHPLTEENVIIGYDNAACHRQRQLTLRSRRCNGGYERRQALLATA